MADNPAIASIKGTLHAQYSADADAYQKPELLRLLADLFREELGMGRTFCMGDSGNLVFLLQAALYLNGYNLYLNSTYDDATQAAVRAYQLGQGLSDTGIAGPELLAMLFPAHMPASPPPPPPVFRPPVPVPNRPMQTNYSPPVPNRPPMPVSSRPVPSRSPVARPLPACPCNSRWGAQ